MGPIGERYAGLYYSFMERFQFDYDFYWHTGDDGQTFEYQAESNTLRPLPRFGKAKSSFSFVRLLLSFCIGNYKSRKIVIVSYPHFPKSLLLAVLLFVLRPFRVRVLVDVQDLPTETPWTRAYIAWWIINQLYYVHGFFILNATQCVKLYARRARGRTIVIPMAAHHNIITPKRPAVMRNGLTLAYVGSVEKRRGFPQVIEIVKKVRAEGFAVDLVINGNIESINPSSYPWLRLYQRQPLESFAELLGTVDLGLIPYVDKNYWGLVSLTKMATYMAAGLPILSLQLTETSNILAQWECGVSVNDWDGFAAALKTFCQDKALRERLGENARRAAVEEYNWAKQVQRLGELVENLRN